MNTFAVKVHFQLSMTARNLDDAKEAMRHEIMALFGEDFPLEIDAAPLISAPVHRRA